MILKLGMSHRGLKLYKDFINDDPGLTLTYFTAGSNWVTCTLEWGKLLQSHLMEENLQLKTILIKNTVNEKNLTPGGCLPLSSGYIHVYYHYYQTSSSLKPLGQSKQILCGASLGSRKESLYKWYRSHDQDGRHAYLW